MQISKTSPAQSHTSSNILFGKPGHCDGNPYTYQNQIGLKFSGHNYILDKSQMQDLFKIILANV